MIVQYAGAVRVNQFRELMRHGNFAAVEVDLHSKYAEVASYGSGWPGATVENAPVIFLGAGENTINTDPAKAGELTTLVFPEYDGYDVFAATLARYTLRVAFVKNGE